MWFVPCPFDARVHEGGCCRVTLSPCVSVVGMSRSYGTLPSEAARVPCQGAPWGYSWG